MQIGIDIGANGFFNLDRTCNNASTPLDESCSKKWGYGRQKIIDAKMEVKCCPSCGNKQNMLYNIKYNENLD